jgi:HEAT repeat protein
MSSKRLTVTLALILLFACAPSFGQTIPQSTKGNVQQLVAVLKSNAAHQEKAAACRQLAAIGTKEAVAPLAALLSDEKLSHMARYGLETIPDPSVDKALRRELGRARGKILIGVIGSLGVRRDPAAVPALSALLKHPVPEVAQTAARALGQIGTQAAGQALRQALDKASPANQIALSEGLFRYAEGLAQAKPAEARVVFDRLLALPGPSHVKAGALRAAIISRGKEGLPLMREHLAGDDFVLFTSAVQTALELPDQETTRLLAEELPRLTPPRQLAVVQILAKRADPIAAVSLAPLAKAGDTAVRIESIRALTQIAEPSSIPALVELAEDPAVPVAQAAREGLAGFPGKAADEAVMSMLAGSRISRRLVALELIELRQVKASVPALLQATRDGEPAVRRSAAKALGKVGNQGDFPALVALFSEWTEPADLSVAEQALADIATRSDDRDTCATQLVRVLLQSDPGHRSAIYRVLSLTGGRTALDAVSGATNDPDPVAQSAAVRSLCSWKTPDAAPVLLALLKDPKHEKDRSLCLRGYLGLAGQAGVSATDRLSMCREAGALLRTDEDTKLLLSVLGQTPSVSALDMVLAHLDNPATRDEAGFAALAISEAIVAEKPRDVRGALQRVVTSTQNPTLIDRAKAVLEKAAP